MIVAKVNKHLQDLIDKSEIKLTDLDGFYRAGILDNFGIIIIDRLEITEANLPFLIMSSKEKLKKISKAMIEKRLELDAGIKKYLRKRFYIDYEELNDMTELKEILKYDEKANIRAAVQDIGIKKVISAVGMKEVIESIDLDQLVDIVGIEKLEELIKKHKK